MGSLGSGFHPSMLDRLTAFVSDLVGRVRGLALQLADGYRVSDRFFKMRLAILGGWAVLTIVTLWASCTTPSVTNSLGADVQVNRDSIMGAQLLVRNESNQIWTDVVLVLDGEWTFTQRTMRPQDLVVLSMSSFKRGPESPPRDYRPRVLTVTCKQGGDRFHLR